MVPSPSGGLNGWGRSPAAGEVAGRVRKFCPRGWIESKSPLLVQRLSVGDPPSGWPTSSAPFSLPPPTVAVEEHQEPSSWCCGSGLEAPGLGEGG